MKERPKRLKAADTQTEEETRNEDLLSRGRLQHATTAKDNDSAKTGSMWHPSSTLRAYSTLSAVDNLVHVHRRSCIVPGECDEIGSSASAYSVALLCVIQSKTASRRPSPDFPR